MPINDYCNCPINLARIASNGERRPRNGSRERPLIPKAAI